MQEIEQKLTELRKKRDSLMTGFFKLGLQIALIFGIPAAFVVIMAKYFVQNEGNLFITGCLFLTFIFSWYVTYRLYKAKSSKIETIESEIRDIKKNLPKKESDD